MITKYNEEELKALIVLSLINIRKKAGLKLETPNEIKFRCNHKNKPATVSLELIYKEK